MDRLKRTLWTTLLLALCTGAAPSTPGQSAAPPRTAPTTAPTTAPAANARIFRDLPYADAPGSANLLDIYLPEHDPVGAKRPLVVWVHGGGWSHGDKSRCLARPLVDDGFVVASINYRLSWQAPFPAQIHDCKAAIRYLRAHADEYGIDKDRVGVFGASAGGHLAALLGTSAGEAALEGDVGGNLDQSSRVQAACDWFGPTDLSKLREQLADDNPFKQHPELSPIAALFGGMAKATPQLVAQANPIRFVDKTDPPFLIMHGTRDPLVPLAQSRMLANALKSAGVACDFRIVQGAGHGTGFRPAAPAVREFFITRLQDATPGKAAAPKR